VKEHAKAVVQPHPLRGPDHTPGTVLDDPLRQVQDLGFNRASLFQGITMPNQVEFTTYVFVYFRSRTSDQDG
jgi:hypothetical protein